jgi:glutathione S-transferase
VKIYWIKAQAPRRVPYVACSRLTIADFQLSSMATYWRESEMPLEAFPNIVRWIDGLMRIPAWAEPWPAERSVLA